DGLPNVIVEAQSQRLPVISTTVSGVPELVSDGENGLLVEPEDPKALSQALQQLIVNTGQRREMGKKGEEKVRRHFDHEKSITDLTGLFASIGITPDGGRP
ncbi:MAG TPA: glycosyltransferase, partial [Rhizobiales bacterium]|nr:glycosyltransferase [Hyphomicrobiales bacterium]